MRAARLLFDVGDEVICERSMITVKDDGLWVMPPIIRSLAFGWYPPIPPPVRIHGVELADLGLTGSGLPTQRSPWNLIGRWRDDGLHVTRWVPYELPPALGVSRSVHPPGPAPPGGWPWVDDTLEGGPRVPPGVLADLTERGVVVAATIFWPTRNQPVWVVTAGDRAEAETALRPYVGDALCIVESRIRAAEVAAIDATLRARCGDWGIYQYVKSIDDDGQLRFIVRIMGMLPDVVAWAEPYSAAWLRIISWLRPVGT